MMNVQILNPLDFPNWDSMAGSLPGYTFFHTSAWCRVLVESYGYEPIYFCSWDGGELRAALPVMEVDSIITGRRGVSLPFSDYCAPLLSSDTDFWSLFEAVQTCAHERGWKFIELRGVTPSILDQKVSNRYCGHRLELSKDTQILQKSLRDSTRRNIRKAQESGIKVEIGQSKEDIKAFYHLNCMTRQRHGLPPQPLGFFKKFFEYVINPGLGTMVLAKLGDNIIAAAVYVMSSGSGGSVLYKYGASDKRYQDLRANNLVMWEAIKVFAGKGCFEMLLGRTDIDHNGLRQFKMGWNTEEYSINYYRYDLRSAAFTNGSAMASNTIENKIFRQTPRPMLRVLGTVLYRHFG